jgi:hypothetical protein
MPRKRAQYFDTRTGRELSEDEALIGGTIRDGVTMRTRMMARDARQYFTDARSFWDANRDALDVRGIGGTEGCRPGWRILDAPINRQAIADARAAYLFDLENAWRNPPTGFGEQGMRGAKEGDPCTENGFSGTLRRDADGQLHCDITRSDQRMDSEWEEEEEDDDGNDYAEARRADSRSIERIAQDHRRNMQRIYDAHARELENAWRANK